MAYEQEKKFLDERDAIRVSYGANPHTGAIELVRRWTVSRAGLQSSCLAYLNGIKYVLNPMADKEKYTGLFRVVRHTATMKKGMPEQEQGVTQVLRLLGTGDYEWLSSHTTLDESYSYAYRDKASPIQAQISEQGTITDAQNTLNENNLYDAEAKIQKSHPYQWTTYGAYNVLGYDRDLTYKNWHYQPDAPQVDVQGTIYDARSTLNRDGTYDGGVGSKTSRPAQWTEATETVTDQKVGYTYRNSRTKPTAPAGTAIGFIYDASSTLQSDGTYNGAAGYQYSKPAQWVDVVRTLTNISAGYSYKNLREKPTAPAETAVGYVYDAKSMLNEDGTYNGNAGYDYSLPAAWHDVNRTTFGINTGYTYLNYRQRPTGPEEMVVGCLFESKSTLNKDGTYNGNIGYGYSLPAEWYDVSDSVLMADYEYTYKNQRSRPTGPTELVQGCLFDTKSTLNNDQTYDGNIGYQYSKPVQWTDVIDTATGTTVGHTYKNQRIRPSAPTAAVQGFLYDMKSTTNKDGTYDGSGGYEYSKPAQWADVQDSMLEYSLTHTYLNQRTRPTAPAVTVQGVIYDAKSTLNKDGTYGGTVGYDYSKPASWCDVTETTLDVKCVNSYQNYRTQPQAATGSVQGFVYDANSTMAKDGSYGGNAGYQYSKPVVMSAHVATSGLLDVYEVAYLNSRTRPTTPATTLGTVYEAKSTLNRDGTYTGGIDYRYSQPKSLYVTWLTGDAGGGRKGIYKYTNWRETPPVIAALTADTDNSVDLSYNADKTFNATIRVSLQQPGIAGGAATITLNDETQTVREVVGYDRDEEVWIIQMWTRHEQYFKSKSSALAYVSGTDHERISVTYSALAGGYWLGVYWVRLGEATEVSTSDG